MKEVDKRGGYQHWGPLTWGRSSWNPWRMVLSSGGGDDNNHATNSLTINAFGWVVRLHLPTILQPWRRWVDTSQYAWAKGPGSGYWEVKPRKFGFSLHEGCLQLFLGPQTNDSTTTRSWCCHLPWTQWRHVRLSLFDAHGKHFWTEWSRPRGFKLRDQWAAKQAVKDACPAVAFQIEDFDGQRVVATTRIEEREWRFGEKWCFWLSLFRKPMVRRSLDIRFATEVGTQKGSWKGGLIGTSIQMLPGELHESAFRRYYDVILWKENSMADRYEKIRMALATRPTPGPWTAKSHAAPWADNGDIGIINGKGVLVAVAYSNRCTRDNASLIAACDPDTIRELLAERDALAAENERLAEALRELVAVFSESGMYDEEVFAKARAALARENRND